MRPTSQRNLPVMEVQSLDRQQTAMDRPQSNTVHSVDRASEWASLPGRALGKAGISGKRAAADAGCDRSLLSARLAAKKHLPWSHLGTWGADFARELVLLIVEFYDLQIGLCEQDRRDLELGRTLRECVQRSVAR